MEHTTWNIEQYGTKDFVDPKRLRPIDYKEAKKALESIKYKVLSIKYNLIIADEINVALKFGLIKVEEVLALIKTAREKGINLILTGRWADKKIIKRADLVTEFKEKKHPFEKGERMIKGIDY